MPTIAERWKTETAVSRSTRSDQLKALDKEVARIQAEYPRWRDGWNPQAEYLAKRVKIALAEWIAVTPGNWEANARNHTGIMRELSDAVNRLHAGPVAKHAAYTVPRSPHTPDSKRVVKYGHQSKMMNCWWQCAKMALDYHVGEATRRKVMSAAVEARKIYAANGGIKWDQANGIAASAELKLTLINLENQATRLFSTEDIMRGLQEYGPLLFGGQFVRHFSKRFWGYGHVILVYRVEYDKVWYHDPAIGLAAARADVSLDWDTFKNGWRDRRLNVLAVDPVFVRRTADHVAAEEFTASLMGVDWD